MMAWCGNFSLKAGEGGSAAKVSLLSFLLFFLEQCGQKVLEYISASAATESFVL
jgi:hypothetical protein